MPEGLQCIDLFAFRGCHSLREVRIPTSVEYIGKWVFDSCGKLTSIKVPEHLRGIPLGVENAEIVYY